MLRYLVWYGDNLPFILDQKRITSFFVVTDIWDQLLSIVGQEAGTRVVDTWFKALSLCRWDQGAQTVYLEAPNAFVKDWVHNHYVSLLQFHLGRLLHTESPKIVFSVKNATEAVEVIEKESTPFLLEKTRMPLLVKETQKCHSHVNKGYLFDTFVVGPNSSFAYAAAHAITEKPGMVYNPLFIYGDSGLGKTHLLHAIGNEILKNHKNTVVLYQTADRFVMNLFMQFDLIKFINFRLKYQDIDVFLLMIFSLFPIKSKHRKLFFIFLIRCMMRINRLFFQVILFHKILMELPNGYVLGLDGVW